MPFEARRLSIHCFTCPEYRQLSDLLPHTVKLEQHVLLALGDANEPPTRAFIDAPGSHYRLILGSSHTVRWIYAVREALVWIGSYRFWNYKGIRAQGIVGSLLPVGFMFIDDILLLFPVCPSSRLHARPSINLKSGIAGIR